MEQYHTNQEFCGTMDGLTFLPVDKVENGMTFLGQNCCPEAEDLLEYFDANYVSGTFVKILRPTTDDQHPSTLHIKRINLHFPPQIWNVFETTPYDDNRTHNYCEGWNNSFHSMVGHSHPSIWRLIRHSQEHAVLVITSVLQETRVELPPQKTISSCCHPAEKLKNLCQAFDDGSKTLGDFLHSIGHLLD